MHCAVDGSDVLLFDNSQEQVLGLGEVLRICFAGILCDIAGTCFACHRSVLDLIEVPCRYFVRSVWISSSPAKLSIACKLEPTSYLYVGLETAQRMVQ